MSLLLLLKPRVVGYITATHELTLGGHALKRILEHYYSKKEPPRSVKKLKKKIETLKKEDFQIEEPIKTEILEKTKTFTPELQENLLNYLKYSLELKNLQELLINEDKIRQEVEFIRQFKARQAEIERKRIELFRLIQQMEEEELFLALVLLD